MESESSWLAEEYIALWKQWGVDTPLTVSRLLAGTPPIAMPQAPPPKLPPKARVQPRPVSPEAGAISKTPFPNLDAIRLEIGDCTRCVLCEARKQIVFGSGNPKTPLLFIGEAPGADEDQEGLPFVGKAGQLLTKIIEAMGYQRDQFYVANVVKCRPPGNRVPAPEEIGQCLGFLKAQIEVIQPKFIVALGLTAATTLTGQTAAISNLRGRFHPLKWAPEIEVMPTYHPAYLLRNPAAKKMVWDDVKQVKTKLESLS